MRVEEKRMVKPLAEIGVGECFRYDEELYIKTDESVGGLRVCVDIRYGLLYRLEEEYMVEPINAKAVVE